MLRFKRTNLRETTLACLASLTLVMPAGAAVVTFDGGLTTFQSALGTHTNALGNADGNGSLNGVALEIDSTKPLVQYGGGNTNDFYQSKTVSLASATTAVQFEYTDAVGYTPNPNRISFAAAASADVVLGQTFKVGTLSYTNGFWYPYANIGLTITTSSSDSTLNATFMGNIIVQVSAPEPFDQTDYEGNADYFYLQGQSGALASLGSARVYEKHVQPPNKPGNVGTFDLYARLDGQNLIPVRFDNPQGGGFLSTSLQPVVTTAVPEPETYAMLLAGLGLIGAIARRRRAAFRG